MRGNFPIVGCLPVLILVALLGEHAAEGLLTRNSRSAGLEGGSDTEEAVGPPELLIMSSPLEKKISYVQLVDFQAVRQTVRPLIDSGLGEPRGLSYHAPSQSLFVADSGLRKIFRYGLDIRACQTQGACGGLDYEIVIKDSQRAVVTDVLATWLDVDEGGNLYFTEPEKNAVSRISKQVMANIAGGYLQAESLEHVTFNEARAQQEAGTQRDSVVQLFGADDGSPVSAPAGLALDRAGFIFWGGRSSPSRGAVVRGLAQPRGKDESLPSPVEVGGQLVMPVDVALSSRMTLFTAEETSVFGLCNGARRTVLLANTFKVPRGVVWDGDNTAYVADFGAHAVFSMPVGLCRKGVAKRKTADFRGVFGLAFVKLPDLASEAQ